MGARRRKRTIWRAALAGLALTLAGCSPPSLPLLVAEPTAAPTLAPSPSATPTPSPSPTPERIIVGLYQCQDLATTRQQIEDAGLRVGTINADSPDYDDAWLVIAQQPTAGREVGQGRRIDLFLVDPSSACP